MAERQAMVVRLSPAVAGGVLHLLALTLTACADTPEGTTGFEDEPPIACSLSPDELNRRREQLLPGLMQRALDVADLEDGLRMQFDSSQGLLAELAAIIEAERTRCSFLRFGPTVEPHGGQVTLDVTGLPGTRELLRAL